MDDEILQDFLIESGELLDALGEQLVELERTPDDPDLLNAVFRSFHTIKGGAGFLGLDPLVGICHVAEDVFNALRQGDLALTPEIMDCVLQSVDSLQEMFAALNAGDKPRAADPELIQALAACLQPDQAEPAPAQQAPVAADATSEAELDDPERERRAEAAADADISDQAFEAMLAAAGMASGESAQSGEASSESDEISDDEFEALLDELHGDKPPAGKAPDSQASEQPVKASPASSADDEITDDEFEALLDELHGGGAPKPAKAGGPESAAAKPVAQAGKGDEITDDEFESLLDELHGKGKPKALTSNAGDSNADKGAASRSPAQQPGNGAGKPAYAPGERDKAPAGPARKMQSESMIRVDTRRLDDIMNMVGELVLVRNRLALLQQSIRSEEVAKSVSSLDLVTSDLQTAVMKTRMQPLKKVFGRFPRVVRDLARQLNKNVDLVLEGEETGLDKTLVDALGDPLVHLVRNAVDHGIESPEERQRAGKPATGRVVLSAEQEGDHILISIADDGKGMDPEKLRSIAVDKKLLEADAAARLTDNQAFELIFMAGFSTASEVSNISGRGVGMDVVRSNIQQINANIEIRSEKGEGTTMLIRVPLTLAILPTLMVALGSQRFAFPLDSVAEIMHLDHNSTRMVDDQEVMMVRGEAMPLFYLQRWMVSGMPPDYRPDAGEVVTVMSSGQRVGFVVDSLIGQEEVVIKPLGPFVHDLESFAGATIGGDGGIALILDVAGMLRRYAHRYAR